MKKYKILITRSLLEEDRHYIATSLTKLVGDKFVLISPETFDDDAICRLAGDADVLLGPYVTEKILSAAKKVKLIQVPWTGMDTFDFSAVRNSDVPVCNSHSNADAVAELGMTLLLDLLKKSAYHDRKMREGNWNRDQKPLDLKSKMLSQQTVCILACGNIGYRMAKLISAFGATVIAVGERTKPDAVVSRVFENDRWHKAVSEADIIISTLPLTDRTRGMINAGAISIMKKGALIINMSRAQIIDEDAVYEALKSGQLGGYAADVWWSAPKRGETKSSVSTHNDFEAMPNVVLSPHRAGFIEGCLPHLDDAIVNLSNLIEGRPLINVVNKQQEY